ncbi:hypothetical protein [Gordonia aquimaris]|uniref:Uncharacterized protein n=1 Tax=Gordonia aquimaris TaxID=2984863 RepID=A0A9X3D5Y5_9ACTN|nr:hypothetical protein [Gordonia aquimaris]MCX2965598.1 hypothetical protein [Gordonia aquimaris]
MSWQTFDTRRRDGRYGPWAIVNGRRISADVILMQREEDTGSTRVVLGFLCGLEYVPAEKIPGWSGEISTELPYTVLEPVKPA